MDGEKYEKESRMGDLLAEKTVYHCRHAGNPLQSSRHDCFYIAEDRNRERKQLEQEIAAEMDTENQNVAMEEETEADQVASILKPQTQSTETAEVEKESEEADSGQEEVAPTGNTSQALHFVSGRWHLMADGRKCDLRLQHGLDGVFCDVRPVQIQSGGHYCRRCQQQSLCGSKGKNPEY